MDLPSVEELVAQLTTLEQGNYRKSARQQAARWALGILPNLSVEQAMTPAGYVLRYLAGADTPTGILGEREFVFEPVDFEACAQRLAAPPDQGER